MAKLNEYIKSRERSIRKAQLELTKAQEKELLNAYLKAGDTLVARIKNETDVLKKKIYSDYAYELHQTTIDIIQKYSLEAVVSQLDNERLITLQLISEPGAIKEAFGLEIKKLVDLKSTRAVEQIIRGEIYKGGAGLSERVWRASSMASNDIQEVVKAAMAQNMSAADMSKLLQDFVEPKARKMWDKNKIEDILGKGYANQFKNLEYNALRLARTTISHSFTQSIKESGKINPFFKKAQWHSVHAAGRTCDVCKAMDGEIYTLEELPFDHPNGLCYITHYFEQSLEEMADRLGDWVKNPEGDSELENWWSNRNSEISSTNDIVKN